MAELEFRDYTILSSSEWKGIEVYNSEGNVASLGNDTGDFRMTDVHYATADELEQIAAKLRELNGEPNTRALDERVKELDAWLDKRARQHVKRAADPANGYDGLVLPNHNVAEIFCEQRRQLRKIFPELKEKL